MLQYNEILVQCNFPLLFRCFSDITQCSKGYSFAAWLMVDASMANSYEAYVTLAELGGVPGARHPLWDPILSFSHTFSLKSACVRGPCPPNGSTAPPTGNPGSATV